MYDCSQIRVGTNARAVHSRIENGVVTLKDQDDKGNKWVEKVNIVDSKITEYKVLKDRKYTYWIKYGEFEKARKDRRYEYIKRYHNKTGKGYHGLTMRYDTDLFGEKGVCYTFYSRGHWVWQKFVYSNGRVAYDTKGSIFRKEGKVRQVEGVYKNGNKLFKIVCPNGFVGKTREGYPFINKQDDRTDYERARYYSSRDQAQKYDYSLDGNCEYTIWDIHSRVKEQGKYENRQQTGEFVQAYKRLFMLNGIAVSKKLYDAKPESIKASRVLNEPNAQFRAMLLKKIGLERVIKECKGKRVDREETTGNELYDFPVKYSQKDKFQGSGVHTTLDEDDKAIRILKVVCPSTKNNYFLRIPVDSHFNTCEKARQGTFNGFDVQASTIKFEVET